LSDAGSSFVPVGTPLPKDGDGGLVASPGLGAVIVGGLGRLIGTFDEGKTWRTLNKQARITSWLQLDFTSPSRGMAIDSNGTLFMTSDGGHKWSPIIF
jgi:photosystem II stability/assembly factor-like uncharacterized protein